MDNDVVIIKPDLAKQDVALPAGCQVQWVEVCMAKRTWKVTLTVKKDMPHDIEAIRQQLLERVSGLTAVDFVLQETRSYDDVAAYLKAHWDEVKAKLFLNKPGLKSWCSMVSYEVKDPGKVLLMLPSQVGLDLCRRERVVESCKEIFKAVVNHPVDVMLALGDIQKEQEDFVKRQQKQMASLADEVPRTVSRKKQAGGKQGPVIMGKSIAGSPISLQQITEEERKVVVEGEVISLETRELRSGRTLVTFDMTDYADSISVKFFLDEKKVLKDPDKLVKGAWVIVRGPVQQDRFSQELTLMADDIIAGQKSVREDQAEKKRVELHLHTKMSAMDSVVDVKEAVACAARWGHEAIAITDHGVLQSFPDAFATGQKHGIKILYGVEAYMVNDHVPIVKNPISQTLADASFVVFDLETTGLSPLQETITEIGAVKMVGGKIVDRFGMLVNPRKSIPPKIVELTGITDKMVAEAPGLEKVLPAFWEFCGDSILVAHNASFDISFIQANLSLVGEDEILQPILDTLELSRAMLPNLKKHRLNVVAKELGVSLENHHRAVDDAQAAGGILLALIERMKQQAVTDLQDVNNLVNGVRPEKLPSFHTVILAENEVGLKNLYRLTTKAHLEYFYKRPKIPRSVLNQHREGLIIGSACEAGELYRAFLNGEPKSKIEKIARYYDYLEIQPRGNNAFLVRAGKITMERIEAINREIVALGKKLGKPVVATGDVHFLEPRDSIYREILMAGQGFEDASDQAPLYLRTTEEMLQEFAYLGPEIAQQVVIDDPGRIAARIKEIRPIPNQLFTPKIEGAKELIEQLSYQTAKEIYGDPLPDLVDARLDKELKSIIGNGFAVIYYIAHKLVKKSLDDGYLVGSRGSVGSSFVATMTEITEVNPLPPHYICSKCQYSEFIEDGSYASGFDLPDKNCPHCGGVMTKNGQDIPFETFLGFEGDKVPDIDLNFSGVYQSVVQKYTEELFGKGYAFKAGTIGGLADKTAYGFVKGYTSDKQMIRRSAEINRLVQGCTGVKRTTGQHPGGVMVVPKDQDIHNFTPIQHPANDKKSGVVTTHFDYHSIHDCLLKLDILGHDDPTAIKMLTDLTGIDAREVPTDDQETISLFSSLDRLGIKPEQIGGTTVGSLAIPEFGTRFVRQMLEQTRPKTFAELVRISGLSHGTDVWINNAQELVEQGVIGLPEVIACRDDIMVYLLHKGLPPKSAFTIMEKVRKGKGLKDEDIALMKEHQVPDWYIGSCQKIKYMFPKAHAAAYVLMAFRIAYFKVHHPAAFYATYFTVRADEFDGQLICSGLDAMNRRMGEIELLGNNVTAKEKNVFTILEVAREAIVRDIGFLPVDLYQSGAQDFSIVDDNKLLCPLGALQGVGVSAAENIVAARQDGPFSSIKDLQTRARVSKTVVEALSAHGSLQGMPATDQLSLF